MLIRETHCLFDVRNPNPGLGLGTEYLVTVDAPWLDAVVEVPWVGTKDVRDEIGDIVEPRRNLFRHLRALARENRGRKGSVRQMMDDELRRRGLDHVLATRDDAESVIAAIFGGDGHFPDNHLDDGHDGPGWAFARFPDRGDSLFLTYMNGVLSGMMPVKENGVAMSENERRMHSIMSAVECGDIGEFARRNGAIALTPGEAEVQTKWLAEAGRKFGMEIASTELSARMRDEDGPRP